MTENPPERTTSPDADNWFTAGRLAGLIVCFLFVLYPGVFFGAQSMFFRDFSAFSYPVAFYTQESFRHGEIPLWNPLIDTGVPFLAQWNTTVCYPLSLIYVLLPLPWSLNIFGFVHLVIAGLGMYFLARRWTGNPLAASVAGVVFALNGLMLTCLMWTSNLGALTWQPWVILCVEQAWRLGGRRRIALAAFAGGMQMLAGAPEIILFTWAMLSVLWLAQIYKKTVSFWQALRRMIMVVLLISGLAAWQLLPFLDLLSHSERDAAYTIADMWPMPLSGWANYLLPTFHTLQSPYGPRYQPEQAWANSYYLGVIVIVLVLSALGRPRQFKVWWLAAAALIGLLLAMGTHGYVYAILKKIVPQIGFARFPIKFIALPTFALPLLAAFGFNRFQQLAVDDSRRAVRSLLRVGAAVLLVTGGILAVATLRSTPDFPASTVWQDGLVRISFLAAILAAMVVLARSASPRLRKLLGGAIVLLAGLDLVCGGLRQNPVVDAKAFGPLELNMTARPRFGESRVMVGLKTKDFLDRASPASAFKYFVGLRGIFYENLSLLENIPQVGGFCSLHPRWEMDMLMMLTFHTNGVPEGVADFLGISQVSDPTNIFTWQPRSTALPLATAGQRPVFADEAQVLKLMAAGEFNPREIVYLPPVARDTISVTNASAAKIIDARYTARHIELVVEAPAPAMVVVAQTYYPNWHAYVDGRSVMLWSANHAYQGLEVPAGKHTVTLRYEDRAFQTGATISLLALVACLALLIFPGASNQER